MQNTINTLLTYNLEKVQVTRNILFCSVQFVDRVLSISITFQLDCINNLIILRYF